LRNEPLNIRYLLEELSFKDSEPALQSLYYAYSDRIMRHIYMYVKSHETAEELTSDVFFALWERRKTIPEINDFNAYIYKIAKFKALNYLRDNKTDYVDLDEVPLDLFAFTETTPEDDYISKELIDSVNEAIEQLPAKTKLAFKLVREDGMKYREAADHLGISVKTLEAHLTAAMKTITKILSLRP
jgi:RNA polymerase sigma-70 factor (ECF subfamily)